MPTELERENLHNLDVGDDYHLQGDAKWETERKRVERELDEGLRPYAPFVPLAPRSVVTYDQQILKLSAIYATDAKLESTSLVLATGVDVFGCRHTPSGAFDLIADDFNYALLLLLLLGLSVGALLLRKAAQAKNLAIQWV